VGLRPGRVSVDLPRPGCAVRTVFVGGEICWRSRRCDVPSSDTGRRWSARWSLSGRVRWLSA